MKYLALRCIIKHTYSRLDAGKIMDAKYMENATKKYKKNGAVQRNKRQKLVYKKGVMIKWKNVKN